jgi:hypothetical protein
MSMNKSQLSTSATTVMITAEGRLALAADALAKAAKMSGGLRRKQLCERAMNHLRAVCFPTAPEGTRLDCHLCQGRSHGSLRLNTTAKEFSEPSFRTRLYQSELGCRQSHFGLNLRSSLLIQIESY